MAAQREDAKKEFQNLHSGLQQAQKGSSQDQLEVGCVASRGAGQP